MLLAQVDFKKLQIILKPAVEASEGVAAIPAVTLNYGQFITDFISFILMALVVFLLVKKVISLLHKKAEQPAAAPPAPSNEELLLTEIRDLLAKKP